MTEDGEAIKGIGMLVRLPDGMPVNFEYGGSDEWRMNTSTGSREQTEKPSNFTPRFSSEPSPGSVIKIGEGTGAKHFKLAEAKLGQEKPNSVYVESIRIGEFNKLVDEGAPVVHPDNEPSDLPTAA